MSERSQSRRLRSLRCAAEQKHEAAGGVGITPIGHMRPWGLVVVVSVVAVLALVVVGVVVVAVVLVVVMKPVVW